MLHKNFNQNISLLEQEGLEVTALDQLMKNFWSIQNIFSILHLKPFRFKKIGAFYSLIEMRDKEKKSYVVFPTEEDGIIIRQQKEKL
jgi:hypothetical protein